MQQVLVNRAAWTDVPEMEDGWLIVNAPRPLMGLVTWTGECRHGVFYAAGPRPATVDDDFDREMAEHRVASWKADDAWPVEFIDNAEIERRAFAKIAEHGWTSFDDADLTVAEVAAMMQLPWHEDGPTVTAI